MIKFTEEQFTKACNCRSDGECTHNTFAWKECLDAAVDAFAADMKKKLIDKALHSGMTGWDDPEWPVEDISHRLRSHVEKGDPIDVANFAMFLWNRGSGIVVDKGE